MTAMLKLLSLILLLSFIGIAAFSESDGSWLNKIPAKEHAKPNPYQDQADAVPAGAHVFAEHCAQCHGKAAEGNKKHPSLRTEQVQHASDGDLHWIIANGNMARGMPAWSKLGDPQIWQLVSYVKSLH